MNFSWVRKMHPTQLCGLGNNITLWVCPMDGCELTTPIVCLPPTSYGPSRVTPFLLWLNISLGSLP